MYLLGKGSITVSRYDQQDIPAQLLDCIVFTLRLRTMSSAQRDWLAMTGCYPAAPAAHPKTDEGSPARAGNTLRR